MAAVVPLLVIGDFVFAVDGIAATTATIIHVVFAAGVGVNIVSQDT